MNPLYGWSISRMRKIEPETESAATKRAATTIVLRGANRPKLAKMTASQKIKNNQERPAKIAGNLLRNQPAARGDGVGGLQRSRLKPALRIRLGSKREQRLLYPLDAGAFADLCRRDGFPTTWPKLGDPGCYCLLQQLARSLRFRTVLGKRPVKQERLRGPTSYCVLLVIERALRRSREQAEHQGRERREHSHGHLDNVLSVFAQVLLRQDAA